MKAKDLRDMKPEQLDAKLAEMKKELVKLGAQVATGTNPKNPSQIRNIKKTMARVLTIKKQKEDVK
ncbi:50S ribosomal protein L29 [Candidatus Woesearchaeota archaeon]|nr:50S ribosomal protein L29 [Candidatus Woesearchaeota archaeon]